MEASGLRYFAPLFSSIAPKYDICAANFWKGVEIPRFESYFWTIYKVLRCMLE